MVFSNQKVSTKNGPLFFNDVQVKEVLDTKHLGMILDSKLNFEKHISAKLAQGRRGLGVMKQMKKWVDKKTLENLYILYTRPHFEY